MAVGLAELLGFCSTVVAAEGLQEKRELRVFHGRVAVGILIVQDMVAVVLLSSVAGDGPSWWALSVTAAVVVSAPLPKRILDGTGHGELLALFGMRRVGAGAYDDLKSQQVRVVGLASDPGKAAWHLHQGRRVVYADAEDPGLWERLRLDGVRGVMLVLPDTEAKTPAACTLRRFGFSGAITATSVFDEEEQSIMAAGCDATFNYVKDAGLSFAKRSWDTMNSPERAD